MTTYFISDLHLCEQQPHITRSFINFCQQQARDARALYILGDLFEYWLGDDALDSTAQTVQKQLKSLSDSGVDIAFMAGNRDFLVGPDYAEQCGMSLLSEPTTIDLYGQTVLLVHGDAQCTDDQAYQAVRKQLRNLKWQQQFLAQSIDERVAFAEQARMKSQEHTSQSDMVIMDVNEDAIQALFNDHQVDTMIHGHTHRPAIHQHGDKQRIVLGDWHHQSSYFEVTENHSQLVSG